MKFNKQWGYGQLFGFSALEGPNRYYDDFILMTMKKKLSFRIEYRSHYVLINFPTSDKVTFSVIMSDFVTASIGGKRFALTFIDNDTLVGVSPVLPSFKGERKLTEQEMWGATVYNIDNHFLGFRYKQTDDGYLFVIHNSFTAVEARSGANYFIDHNNIDALLDKYMNYYVNMPKCNDKKYESLYLKALSINKVNTHTPEGKIGRVWTTPDRVPHRHMWMWDSAFHCITMSEYNHEFAEQAFLAMLEQTRDNGFMPHMANPTDCSDVTQPCIMSWGAYNIYQNTKNIEFLKQCVPYLEKYLVYDIENRDENKNGLLEWFTEPDYTICKCGESGLDNSPRFDFDEKMDCMDFTTYLALDSEYLSKIYDILGDKEKSEKWLKVHQNTSNLINKYFWNEEGGYYCDRLFDGKLTKVLTHTSFLPMFAGIASKEQAEKMVKTIMDESLINTPFPFASISQDHPTYSTDMWRGGSWLNVDYFIISGLRKYGYNELADSFRDRILEKVNNWYKKTGVIFEFYDSQDKVSPFMCKRKGEPLKNPDYRKHVHSISDYNWSACFTILFIQNLY